MSMASSKKKAGFVLALLLVALTIPGWGEEKAEEKAQQPATSTSASAQTESQAETPSGEEVRKPAASPSPGAEVPIQTPPESSTPPTVLRKVGDHWTPYEPPDPESFPEGATIHVIVSGDNLWNLANTHFQNSYLWPQIWNENRFILDSHWIYPGDPLLLPPRPTVVSEIIPATGQTAPPLPPAPDPGSLEESVAPPVPPGAWGTEQVAEAILPALAPAESGMASSEPGPIADHDDIYCTGEIRRDYQKPELYIANEEQEKKIGLTEGDIVYLNAGRQGNRVQPGDVFQVVVKQEEVFHPVTDKWLGTYVHRAGRVKVLAVQENTAIAQITESCGDRIEVGFELETAQEIPVPEYREVPFSRLDVEPSGKANGYVVRLQDDRSNAFTGNVVDVDLGSEDGLNPGDILQIYVSSTPPAERRVKYRYKWRDRRYESQDLRSEDSDLLYPRKPVGHLMVLTTGEKTSTAKIIYTVREIGVGSKVEVR